MDDDRNLQSPQNPFEASLPAILPSRYDAFEQLTHAWANGLIRQTVLTGDSGAGKTWLWRVAAESARTQSDLVRWVSVPQLPGGSGLGLLQTLRFNLEDHFIEEASTAEQTLSRVERRVYELSHDGFRVELVIEESHHLKREGFEVIRILQERLKSRGVHIGVLYVGQSLLLERFSRLSRHGRPVGWHLPHIALKEAMELLRWSRPDHSWTRAEADWIHRETLGNPRRIVRWSETWKPSQTIPSSPDSPIIKPGFGSSASSVQVQHVSKTWSEPLLPVKPPLEESEGLIEVGYDGEDAEISGSFYDPSDVHSAASANFVIDNYTHHEPEPLSGPHVWKDSGESYAPYGRPYQDQETVLDEELDPL
jgi:type II secretory pathway predicted ATPase ExeA